MANCQLGTFAAEIGGIYIAVHSQLVSCIFAFGVMLFSVVVTHTNTDQSHPWQHPNESLHQKTEPVQWSPDLQVVIEDDNQITLERKAQLKNDAPPEDEHNSLLNYFTADKPEMELSFESKRFSSSPEYSSPSAVNYTESENESTSPAPISRQVSYNRYSHKSMHPSFSKIPDFVSEQLMASDVQSIHVPEEPKRNVARSVVVPIGTRVHTIKYKDYSKPESVHLASSYFSNYEPNIIEVPSSKPVLPIVFNFRTKSSPIVATQTHFKLANSSPKVQYFETNEPPQIHSHVVHKPIYQNLREIIVPYRVYVQEIAPVQEYKQTIAHVNKDHHQSDNYPAYLSNYVTPHSTTYGLQQNSLPATYDQSSEYSNTLSPVYGYSSMLHKNPYMDISYHIPYRIEDLYKKPLVYEQPKYLSLNRFNKYN